MCLGSSLGRTASHKTQVLSLPTFTCCLFYAGHREQGGLQSCVPTVKGLLLLSLDILYIPDVSSGVHGVTRIPGKGN